MTVVAPDVLEPLKLVGGHLDWPLAARSALQVVDGERLALDYKEIPSPTGRTSRASWQRQCQGVASCWQ
jgi:hypothetical protein